MKDENEFIVSTSNTHNHSNRSATTRAPSFVREIIIKSVAAELSQSQVRRAVQNGRVGMVTSTQISSLLSYHRLLHRPCVYSVNDFRS
ncbi:unnamed protein product [Didymodactylos carnosus]|uniref:Uncharacterized protein n=1 Tax=Didymodactylos carnosus TaxID=1234261 RepID=A0A8S2F736_9BILA|nr:unnamed protein product [Didymodactylos carnosus]CAF4161506.1 unnamed protein product [Didymodactylos carnosus]